MFSSCDGFRSMYGLNSVYGVAFMRCTQPNQRSTIRIQDLPKSWKILLPVLSFWNSSMPSDQCLFRNVKTSDPWNCVWSNWSSNCGWDVHPTPQTLQWVHGRPMFGYHETFHKQTTCTLQINAFDHKLWLMSCALYVAATRLKVCSPFKNTINIANVLPSIFLVQDSHLLDLSKIVTWYDIRRGGP